MISNVRYPSLYQINTRVWLTELSGGLGRPATLDDIPDSELDGLAEKGFDWIWLLSVWQTGMAGQRVSRTHAEWRKDFEATLSDLRDEDIPGSGFAVTEYRVHKNLGGDEAIARLRSRMSKRGLKLMLDFVPNHTALDHPWVDERPDFYIRGTDDSLAREPGNYVKLTTRGTETILAYGRDPYFPGWPDALQLNYGNPALHEAMIENLIKIAGQCDGVRCDMAMLILPEVFERTWGIKAPLFWPSATARVREQHPAFCFMAEVYWDLEWTLLQQGFDYTYDKRLYDRLREGHARPVREHFWASLDYQSHQARFLENHDEGRAAVAFSQELYEPAAVLTYLSPGLRFFQKGQFEGFQKRVSPHLGRSPNEPIAPTILAFYERLLPLVRRQIVREGDWRLLESRSAWDGNWTWDCCVACSWEGPKGERLLVVANYAGNQSQFYLALPFDDLAGTRWRLRDCLGPAEYIRDGDSLKAQGLYLDLAPWQYHVFELSRTD